MVAAVQNPAVTGCLEVSRCIAVVGAAKLELFAALWRYGGKCSGRKGCELTALLMANRDYF